MHALHRTFFTLGTTYSPITTLLLIWLSYRAHVTCGSAYVATGQSHVRDGVAGSGTQPQIGIVAQHP